MTLGILMGLGLAGNLLTLYMFYEMMTLITVPLVIHNGSREAVAAGFKYLGYSTFGAGCVDRIFSSSTGTAPPQNFQLAERWISPLQREMKTCCLPFGF